MSEATGELSIQPFNQKKLNREQCFSWTKVHIKRDTFKTDKKEKLIVIDLTLILSVTSAAGILLNLML